MAILQRKVQFVHVLLFCFIVGNSKAEIFNIGAIFEYRKGIEPSSLIKAFSVAVQDINNSEDYDFQFVPFIKVVHDNPYEAMINTCSLLEEQVIAIFGPFLEDNSNIVQSISDAKEVPHIEVRWDDNPLNGTIVNVHPYPDILTRTYLEIIEKWEWKDFVILYENDESLHRVGELLKLFDPAKHRIIVRQLTVEYRIVLKELWRSGATHFVLDCTIDILPEVLLQAQQVGLMTNKQHYIITNLDLHTIQLIQYQYGETNITGMRFVNPDDENLISLAAQIYEVMDGMELLAGWKLKLEEALLYDAVRMFAEAIKVSQPIKYPVNLSCHNDDEIFSLGTSIINFMKNLEYEGLTGRIKFDITGFRTNVALDITELREGGVTKVGEWNSSHLEPLSITRTFPPPANDVEDIRNRTFIVIITLTEPYGMEKESSDNLQGNDRYEGFAVDLINELSMMRGFNYTLVVRDPKVGKYDNATGRWTGIIGDLRERRADLAITDLTITYEREEAVDFTSPFMMLGISILYQKPTKAPPSFFSFADPFAWEVWRLLMVACVGVAFILFVVGRISPTEWENPYPCIEEPEFLVNQLDLRNCAWFVTGSIMQQGSEIELKSVATRMVAGMWWFFTLLMVSSYTANLAAFLTTETPDPHFTNLKELIQNAEEKDIKYGAKVDGATANFFRDKALTGDETYVKAWKFMEEHKSEVMINENKDGVTKAEKSKYAFFMESSSIEYTVQRKCNLHQVNGLLDEKGYGIAMRKNESYRSSLSTGILMLQNSGKIEAIKRKWWQERKGGGQCSDEGGEGEATPLNLSSVFGVFVVTLVGTGLAILMAMMETFLHTLKKSFRTKVPFMAALKEEVSFYFKFREMVKPVSQGSEGSSSHQFQSQEKELPYDLVNKQMSVETLGSYTNSNKSKKSKKSRKEYNKQKSNNTC